MPEPMEDPQSGSYQAYSYDMLYLDRWVDELLKLNEKEMDPPVVGSIDHHKQQARRYHACFSELLRKTAIAHPDLARLFKKVWAGTGAFVARLLSDYDFQVSKSGTLEDKMKELLEASELKVFWTLKDVERMKVDFALERARALEMESEYQVLSGRVMELKDENSRLRKIIYTYIEGLDDKDDEVLYIQQSLHNNNNQEVEAPVEQPMSPLSRTVAASEASVGSGSDTIMPTQALTRGLSVKQKSGAKLTKLMSSESKAHLMKMTIASLDQTARTKMQSLNVQDDQLDRMMHDVIKEDLKQEHFLSEIESLLKKADLSSYLNLKLKLKGESGIPESGVIKAEAACQTDMSTLLDVDKAVFDAHMSSFKTKGTHLPLQLRPHMSHFPKTLRIPSLHTTATTIVGLLLSKLRDDTDRDKLGLRRRDMCEYVHLYYRDQFGAIDIADMQVTQLVRGLQQHRGHKRVRLFSKSIGTEDVSAPPPFALRDVNFLLQALRYLDEAGELGDRRIIAAEASGKIALRRKTVIAMSRYLLGGLLPDGGEAFAHRMESMAGPTDHTVDLDDVLEECACGWGRINDTWRRHLTHLFKKYCRVFVVLDEMGFAADDASTDSDTLLVEVDKLKYKKAKTRPLRRIPTRHIPSIYRVNRATDHDSLSTDSFSLDVTDMDSEAQHSGGSSVTSRNLDASTISSNAASMTEVVELLDLANLKLAMKRVNPDVTEEQIRAFFEEGTRRALLKTKEQFDAVWSSRIENGHVVWLNAHTRIKQHTPPYTLANFVCAELEVDVWVQLALEEELLAKCPFVCLMDRAPEELWANREVFMLQIEEGTIPRGPSDTRTQFFKLDPELLKRPLFKT